ncbi:NADP-dependent oxidoreductase domain-containing protein [Daldinia caldariorum]|uniref:NADP-dependent oxidoreductase domain-containing protein n=1 Tax=Daldinia caldariorum TaxID=326644 RepID=UPI002007731F|nr:NADP-dependent oxidoreductase domain-containing protein [Daldinia caldariorum]KAI1463684.1 NADP-dependent oxidoreductase domain-containing protein [Daldinia caldariorum]
MDPPSISPLLDRLEDELDNLEEALQPILGNISDVANKLPLLDKAKLYVLATYSIESMLFSSLRLNGVDAKEHPVFKELARVRQYFDKIKNIETPPEKPEQTLNKEAAIRFIKADLAENNNKVVNTKLSEMIAKERAKAALKAAKAGGKRKAEVSAPPEETTESNGEELESEDSRKKKKKEKKEEKKHKDKKNKKTSKIRRVLNHLAYFHPICARVDPNVPVETSIKTLAELVKECKIGGIGLSEVSANTIRKAYAVHPISAVEIELSLFTTDPLHNVGIPIVAYSPVGRGWLTGKLRKPKDIPANDYRRMLSRFQPGIFEQNLQLIEAVEQLAKRKGVTTAQVAIG